MANVILWAYEDHSTWEEEDGLRPIDFLTDEQRKLAFGIMVEDIVDSWFEDDQDVE